MRIFDVNPQIQVLAIPFVRMNIFERILDTFNQALKIIVICINQSHYFNRTTIVSVTLYVLTNSYLSYILQLDLMSYTIARLLKTTCEIVMYLRVVLKHYPIEGQFIPPLSQLLKKISIILVNSMQCSLSIYGEIMAFELCTFFVAGQPNINQVGAWVIFQNIMQYSLFFGLSQASIARSTMGFLRGI